ncbi:MAG: N-acetyltransferase [Chloroflexia bacterium]|nr:N-acetyltransferase [Chloroflexia bacterium]
MAAFTTPDEADMVDALRADPDAWLPGLSVVTVDEDGTVVGHALMSRCHVDGMPALVLGPCAVVPAVQGRGAGSAAIQAGLETARKMGENLVVVLGHAGYYPRFGFLRASRWKIAAPFSVPEDVMMALQLDPSGSVPSGTVEYPRAFGI